MSMPGNVNPHPISEWGKSLARQSEKKFSDINYIMAKYEKTGVLPPATRQGFFADVSGVGDYREALDRVEQMQAYFDHVPARIKKEFNNDAAEFLDFVTDPKNDAKLEEWGLIAKSDEDVPTIVPPDNVDPVVDPPPDSRAELGAGQAAAAVEGPEGA